MHTPGRPPVRRDLAVAQDEHDQHEAGGDEQRANPVHPAIHTVADVSLQRRVGVDRHQPAEEAGETERGREEERRAPSGSMLTVRQAGANARTRTYAVSCVSKPPRTLPKAAPTGPPAEKVANAIERSREGGKAWARMPSWMYAHQYMA
jgi:hypothetical protein